MPHAPGLFPPHIQPLTGSDLHVWCATLSGSAEALAHFRSLLTADEQARAERFYFERDRDRYIFGRGILRTLLAGYLGMQAAAVPIGYGPHRKPTLESSGADRTLHFNLAHCNAWAAYVFGWDRAVGIDIEHVRPMPDVDDLVQRFFTAGESDLIHSLSGTEKWDTFFQIWTCKEAVLKAHGSGLATPLNEFEIAAGANGAVTITPRAGAEAELTDWSVQLVELVPGYRSAIAVKGSIGQIQFHSVPDQA